MTKNRIISNNRPSYVESAASKAASLRRYGWKARKQRSDAGKKRK
jgi:hypothetical protein